MPSPAAILAKPQIPVLARPMAALPTPPLTPVVIVPVLVRPVTVATVTRNLQAALGPQTPPPAPTTQGFPGFVSRSFNQVSQHQPGVSNANHLSGLANLFNKPVPAAPERRVAERPAAPARPPAPARPAVAQPPAAPSKPDVAAAAKAAVAAPQLAKKPEPPKAPLPLRQPAELAKPPVVVQSKPPAVPARPVQNAAAQTKPPAPAPAPTPAQAPLPAPKLELPKLPAAPKLKEEEDKKPPVGIARTGKPVHAKATTAMTASPSVTVQPKTSESKPGAETPKVESKAPVADAKPARELDPARSAQEPKSQDRVESPAALAKAPAVQTPARVAPPANLEKVAQIRPEANELKVGEVQRQQVNSLQVPVNREQMALVQQNGAGLSAGGGSGHGGGGGQGRQQRRHQEGEEALEEIGGAEALGGDDQVQWWHLRGEDNLRAMSSELREAMFLLRTSQRPLGVDPKQVRLQKTTRSKELLEQPQVQVDVQEQPQQAQTDQVELEAAELCSSCGSDLGGVDPRRCPVCLRQAALATLALLVSDGRFIAYRVFLTKRSQPVASRAVYRLRDFSSLPSGAYCVQAA